MKIWIAALGLVFAAAVGPAQADEIYKQCIDRTTTNPEWGKCGGEWVEREEGAMNAALADILEKAGEDQKAAINAEQAAWETYRDSVCHFYDTDLGREGQVLGYPGCVAQAVHQRTELLGRYLGEFEGR